MKKIVQQQLGELLIAGNLLTREQLEEALAVQKEKGGLIGQILVSLGHTSEEAIARALTMQYGFAYLPLAGYEIDRDVAAIIPEEVARRHGLIAVDRVGKVLTVAMSNPLNAKAVEEVENVSKLKIQVFISTSTDVHEAINRGYRN